MIRPEFRIRAATTTLVLSAIWLLASCGSPTATFPNLVVTTEELPPIVQGQTYEAIVQAEGGNGTYTWSVASGTLPPGVALTGTDGAQAVLSGPALTAGVFTFTLQVQSGDGQTATKTFTIGVVQALAIATGSLPNGNVGTPYTQAVHAVGGDGAYFWELTSGALPPGLALSIDDLGVNDQAIISGSPEEEGTFTFRLTVTSGDGQTASRQFTISIGERLPLTIVTPAVPPALAGVTGATYDVQLEATGGNGPFQWSLVGGSLPAGLTLTADGRIQGTPTTPGVSEFTVEVRGQGESSRRTFTLEVVQNRPGEFNITIFSVTDFPPGILPHLQEAVAGWEAAITGNLQPVLLNTGQFNPQGCGGFIRLVNGTATDDLMIILIIAPIDGPGGILASAGPCLVRTVDGVASGLPPLGVVIMDSDDLLPKIGDQELTHIISHEIGHVLGFGTLWNFGGRSLLAGGGTGDPRFTGQNAVQAFQAIGGTGTVPVENTGGSGTRDSHWRQAVFGTERMTGFSAGLNVFQPLSRVSIASLLDLGYAVDLGQADAFTLPAALALPEGMVHYREILLEPIGVVYPDGRTRPLNPR
jgi:hypothetical protein